MKKCKFCNKNKQLIVSHKEGNICQDCIESAQDELNASLLDNYINDKASINKLVYPQTYKGILDDYVINQTEAKKKLSVAIFNHIQRIDNPELSLNKNNILFIGPTGSGKTLLAETIAEHIDIPFAIINTTSLTISGYVGEDISSVFERLWIHAGKDIKKAEKGIVFLDEVDKNAASQDSTGKDPTGRGVQQELLKILEGDKVKFKPGGKEGPDIVIDTSNILFIAGGAFVGLKKKIGVQVGGLHKNIKDENTKDITTEDLIKFGMIPEFIGRFPIIATLEEIDHKAMMRILTEPKNNIINKYQNLFNLHGIELNIDDKAISEIANKAIEKKTGARGLNNIVEEILSDYVYRIDELLGKPINLTHSYNKFKNSAKG